MGKKADKLRRAFEHRLEELSEQFEEVLALVRPADGPLAEERATAFEVELRARVAGFDARCAESLVALRERAEVQTDEEVARWSTAASGRIDDALRAIDEQADVAAAQVASRAAEVLAVAERTAAEAQEHSRQRLDDAARFEDDLRARVAEFDACCAESLVALRERAEVQTDEEVARWSTAASGRIDDALRAIDEQADVAAAQVASRAAEVLAVAERTAVEAQEHSRQCRDEAGVLEAELRARVAGFDARCAESLVALRERAEVQTDEEVARWSTAASGRIDDALRAIDEQADVAAAQIASRAAEVVAEAQEHSRQRLDDAARFEDDLRARLTEQADVAAGQLASRVAEILAVAEQTVAEAQERSRQRLDDSAVFEAELRARLTEQSDVAAGQLASRVAEILVVAERAVTEAQERSRLQLDHAVASIEQPAPAEVLEWRALSDPDPTDALWEPLTNGDLDGGSSRSDEDDDFFGRMATELRNEESRHAFPAAPVAVGSEMVAFHPSAAMATASWMEASQGPAAEPLRRRPLKVRVSLAALAASTEVLARCAADERVRLEVVHVATGGRADSFLRLTAYNMSGWWEYHDVPAQATAKTPQSAVVDLGELANALQHERQHSGDAEIVVDMDGDLTMGTTLLLDRPDLDPLLPYHRERIEPVDLRAADRSGLSVETQIGRVSISPRLVSFLRTRNYRTSEIVSVDGEPYLAAEIAGPTEGTAATIITRLGEAGAPLDENAQERRNAVGTEVTQLVRALSPDTTGEELEQILHDGVGYARRRAAAHPALPPTVIHGLIHDGTEAIRAAAASNPSADETSCTLAATDDSEIVRAALAANPAVTPECLAQLAADPVAHVREHAAANPGATRELLATLAEDADSSVRAAAAAQPGIEPETLSTLAHDPDSRVCAAVAGNPSCPSELLSELLALVPDAVLANPSAPSTVLAAGSRIDARRLRAAVAANPATPAKQLQSLARDGNPEVVRAVAENPSTPANVRRRARRRLSSFQGDSVSG